MSNAFDPFARQPDREDQANEFVPTGPAGEPTLEPQAGGGFGPAGGEIYAREPLGQPTPTTITQKPRGGGSRWGLIVTLVLLVALGGGGGFAAWNYREVLFGKTNPDPEPNPGTAPGPIEPADTFAKWMTALKDAPDINSVNAEDANTDFRKILDNALNGNLKANEKEELVTWLQQQLVKENLNGKTRALIEAILLEIAPGLSVTPGNTSAASLVPASNQMQLQNTARLFSWPSLLAVASMQIAAVDPDQYIAPMGLSDADLQLWNGRVELLKSKTDVRLRINACMGLIDTCVRTKQYSQANRLVQWGHDAARRSKLTDKEMQLLQKQIAVSAAEQADQMTIQRLAFDELLMQEEAKRLALMKQVEDAQTAQGTLRTEVTPVLGLVTDRVTLKKQAGLINARILDLAAKKVDATKLAPLQKRLVDLQPELTAMAPLSTDQGVRLFAELQSLDAETTNLQFAVPAASQPQVSGPQVTFAKSGMIDLLQRLNLDAKSLQDLKPKDMNSPSHQLWTQLEADLKALQQRLQTAEMPPRELTSQEYAEVTSKLSGVVYAANRLQAERELAAAGTNPGSGSGTSPAAPDPRVAALVRRLTALESAKPPVDLTAQVTENSNSIRNLNSSVTTAQKSIEAIKSKSVAVTLDPNQLEDIRRKVEQNLKNNPPSVPNDLRPDPPLAREYAAPAYHYYYSRNWGKAYEQFMLAAQSDPYNPAYRYFLALILFEQGKLSDALKEARIGRHLEQRGKAAQISTLLQKVQGPSRVWLEDIRMSTKMPGSAVARNP